MFRPLAWTKTLALIFCPLLSITLVPALMPLFSTRKASPRIPESRRAHHPSHLSTRPALVPASLEDRRRS